MSYFHLIISAIIGYLLGCFQTAYIVGKLAQGIDIRNYGSNNAGASNVSFIMGFKYGIFTAIVDVLKATAAVVIINNIFPKSPDLLFVAGAFCILGHIFPFYLNFKGGKGAASLIGMTLAIDFKLAVIAFLTIFLITIVMDCVALGSIGMFTMFPIATCVLNYSTLCVCIGVFLAFICYYKHYINIRRILNKEEVGLRKLVKK